MGNIEKKQLFHYVGKSEPIIVADDICGSGKTSLMLEKINKAKGSEKFIFITPYLDEVERVINNTNKRFVQPETENSETKLEDFKELLRKGRNICTTHSLFHSFDETVLDLISLQNYTLILDEITSVVEPVEIKKGDLKLLLDGGIIEVDQDNRVHWIATYQQYDGNWNKKLKPIIESGQVYIHNGVALLWLFPSEIFKQFRQVYILTYLWEGQLMHSYFQMNKIDCIKKSVGHKEATKMKMSKDGEFTVKNKIVYELVDYKKPNTEKFKQLIEICEDEKLNNIGFTKDPRGFDKLTFSRLECLTKSSTTFKPIKNNLYTWFKSKNKGVKAENCMWTSPKKIAPLIKPSGFASGFVSSNARASNQWADRDCCAYILNKFANPNVVGFFSDNGVEFNEDIYAVSELLQWLFRSSLRNNQPIKLYLPSTRMRTLLKMWMDGQL